MTYIPKEQLVLLDHICDNIADEVLDVMFANVETWYESTKKTAAEEVEREIKKFSVWLTTQYFKENPLTPLFTLAPPPQVAKKPRARSRARKTTTTPRSKK